ncbi:adenylate cyclase [Pholiota molesta]|nr:adenylate cyclase [Pholiota molesta]
MEHRDSTIRLSADLVDQNGLARFALDEDDWAMPMMEDAIIAPWIDQDVPPTPPPKPTPIGPQLQPPARKFGSSLSSLVPSSFLGRGNGGSTSVLSVPDDNESGRGLSFSSSSTNSRELRTRKSSSKLFAKLKHQQSKQHLRSESSDSEHPSLRHPVPPLPQPHNNSIFNASTPTIVSIPATITKAKRTLGKKKSSHGKNLPPPTPPPKDTPETFPDFHFAAGIVDFSPDQLQGIVNVSKASTVPASSGGNPPSFDSQPTFSNPFPSASSTDGHEWPVTRKPSNPLPPHSLGQHSAVLEGPSSSPTSSWTTPPSWSVTEKRSIYSESVTAVDTSDDGSSDSEVVSVGGPKRYEDRLPRPSNAASASFSSMTRTSRGTLHGLPTQAAVMYQIRIHLPDGSYQLASINLETTVAQLTATALRDIEKKKKEGKFHPSETVEGRIRLYLKEQKRERMLGPNEKPAAIVKLRMEQAGYTVDDGNHLMKPDNLSILLRFVYKDQLLAGEAKIDFDDYEIVNLMGRSLRTIPIIVHKNAEHIVSLRLSRNPMLEIPLDFIQSCTALRELRLTHMYMKQVPESVQHCTTLYQLDISSNAIKNLEDTALYMIPSLFRFHAQNNRLSTLPLHFAHMRTLKRINISNNKFRHSEELDISFNMITELPAEICKFPDEVANLLNLETLDVRRNNICDLSLVCRLPKIQSLSADHNAVRALDLSLGSFVCGQQIDSIPSTIGKLQKLEVLDAHNNNINELPPTLWNCASLMKINLTSNFLSSWPDLPVTALLRHWPSLWKTLHGRKSFTDNAILPLMVFEELQVLNLSFNELQDLPPNFFHNLVHLQELYLSGNKLISVPVEDLSRLQRLTTLFLNGNKLQTLPQELGKVVNLRILDVGSNYLKYNINNWEFDWNWNFNKNLRYLNLSGNRHLQIKGDSGSNSRTNRQSLNPSTRMLSGFKHLSQLKVLGLMDVTITTTTHDTTVDIPDESVDRRVRTSLSTVCKMGYGIADSLGNNETLMMLDLVHASDRNDQAVFAMFGRTHPPPSLQLSPTRSSPNLLTKHLHDNFVNVFRAQLEALDVKLPNKDELYSRLRKERIPTALTRTFLKLNQDLCLMSMSSTARKSSLASTSGIPETQHFRTGVAAVVVFFSERTLYAANVGDALAVVSRQGVCQQLSRKHDPFDRTETSRIRTAEGYISPAGLVNDEVEVSRAFGCYHLFPPINARPDVFVYELSEMDEFVIIANRGLWDYIPYQTAVDITRNVARTQRPDPMLAAQKLRDFAISYGADGSTMIMVLWVADLFSSPAPDPLLDYRRLKKPNIRDGGTRFLEHEIPAPVGIDALHNTLLRRQLRFCGGYEVKTEGDAFMCSFPTSLAAVWWCLTVQIYDADDRLIARGLSVRMGIHSGMPLCEPDLITGRMDYFGPMVNQANELTRPQTQVSVEGVRKLGLVIKPKGEVKLKGIEFPENLFILYPSGLEARHDLQDTPPDPSASVSRVQFSASQLEELGMLCLRIEALSSGVEADEDVEADTRWRRKPTWNRVCSTRILALLPPVNELSTDAELMRALDSLSLRVSNAVESFLMALREDGALDDETLQYIASVWKGNSIYHTMQALHYTFHCYRYC